MLLIANIARLACGFVILICIAATRVAGAQAAEDEPALRFDAQFRERFESSVRPGFGLVQEDDDSYGLHRLLLSGEVRLDEHLELTAQLVSGAVTDADIGMPGNQDDSLDVLQLFADGSFGMSDGQLLLRGGRQLVALGSARLVSTRDNTNVRRVFDGIRATWTRAPLQLDGFFLRPVQPQVGEFNDGRVPGQTFWGLYLTRTDKEARAGVDTYYLGIRAPGQRGIELRHTLGARWFGSGDAVDWNLEAAGQWGSIGALTIRAWTLSADIGHTVSSWRFAPRVGIKADVITGDDGQDSRWGTFNPLFPRLSYFSDANVATPANLLDIQPTLSAVLAPNLRVSGSWNLLWRYSTDDAFYLPASQAIPLDAGSGRYLGQQWSCSLDWKVFPSLTLSASHVSFQPGAALRRVGGGSGRFAFVSAQIDL